MTSPMTLADDIAILVSETNSSEISSVVLVNVSSEVIPDCYQTNVYLGLFREINLTLTCLLFRTVTLANFCLLWRNTALNNSIFMNFIVICKVNPDAQTCTRWIYKGTHTHTLHLGSLPKRRCAVTLCSSRWCLWAIPAIAIAMLSLFLSFIFFSFLFSLKWLPFSVLWIM